LPRERTGSARWRPQKGPEDTPATPGDEGGPGKAPAERREIK